MKPQPANPDPAVASPWRVARRLLGAVLIVVGAGPLYLLLPEASIPGSHALRATGSNLSFIWLGFGLALLVAAVVSFWLDGDRFRSRLKAVGDVLARPSVLVFALVVGILASGVSLLFTLAALDGKPPFIDAMAQLVHARYMAAGVLAGPTLEHGEFWMFQNLVMTDEGWLSQYPPGHLVLLAAGLRIGLVELVGPLMAGVAAFFTALAAERLLPDDRPLARLAALLAGLSPFLLFLSGSFMNHVTAAAFAALAIYALTRAWDDGALWAVIAGAAVGAVFAVRPLTGLVVGVVVAAGLFRRGAVHGTPPLAHGARRLGGLVLGALPFGVAVGLYNARFFGSPFRFGYTVAQGPAHDLGFHPDPWGTMYGLPEAIGYTASDLVALSRHLFHSPLPLAVLVGLYLVTARRLTAGRRVIVGWAVLPVLANLFYWHHDLLMGPRMLAEAAPAWALLSTIALVELARRVPDRLGSDSNGLQPSLVVTLALLFALLAGLGYNAPRQAAFYGGDWQASSRIEPPRTPAPALVFVHEDWTGRLGARLAGRGLRQDSVVRLLSTVPPCVLQAFLDGLAEPGVQPTDAQLERIDQVCRRESQADRVGTLGLPDLLWQGDLPGLPPDGAMFVRDLGPRHNRRVLDRFPRRQPLVALPAQGAARGVELYPYERAMRVLWEPSSGPAEEGRGEPPP